MRKLAVLCSGLVLAGCVGEPSDLKQFVKESEKNMPRRIEPLPQVKPFAPFAYEGFDLPDPFKPRKLVVTQNQKGELQDEIKRQNDRRKEPLESFPLEQLKMVGTLQQGKDFFALVKAEKTLYRVSKGNYMGQNFGLITEITDGEVKLKEIVQDGAGDWTERVSSLPLLEEPDKGGKK
jgi:type IV pilus assembly protein PilP